jgi:hypothetical protein
MSALKRLLEGKETPLARAVVFTSIHCIADKKLGEQAAAELLEMNKRIEKLAAAAYNVIDTFENKTRMYDALMKLKALL